MPEWMDTTKVREYNEDDVLVIKLCDEIDRLGNEWQNAEDIAATWYHTNEANEVVIEQLNERVRTLELMNPALTQIAESYVDQLNATEDLVCEACDGGKTCLTVFPKDPELWCTPCSIKNFARTITGKMHQVTG